jgi:predicted SnoaL-like aldol condensation-catalyzing enzyme
MAGRTHILAAAALVALGGCATTHAATAGTATACDSSPEANRQVVLAFYREGLVGLQPRAAFERYASPGFVEHKPDVPEGTRAAAAAYLEQLIRAVPQPRWEILRTVAEGDLVFLHASFTPAPGAPAYAIADVFRLENCKIAEHWDVVAPPPKDQRNPNPRF